jgi:hypothetical protein
MHFKGKGKRKRNTNGEICLQIGQGALYLLVSELCVYSHYVLFVMSYNGIGSSSMDVISCKYL